MKKKLKIVTLLCALALATVSCKDNDDDGGKDDKNGNKTEDATKMNFGYTGEKKAIKIDMGGQWYAESDRDWCQLVRTEGTGSDMVDLNIAYNTTKEQRTATITVNSGLRSTTGGYSITITQAPNTLTEIPPAFTAAKLENGKIYFKMWTGPGMSGDPRFPINGAEGSQMSYYPPQGVNGVYYLMEYFPAKVETDWSPFATFNVMDGVCTGKLSGTTNSIVFDQTESVKYYGDSPVEGTAPIYFVLGGKLYYGGGQYNTTTSFYRFDPVTGSQTQLKDLPANNGWATIMNGTVYGCFTNGGIYTYNVSGDSWTSIGTFTGSPGYFYAHGNKLYLGNTTNRYECVFGVDGLELINLVYVSNISGRICNDEDGNLWLINGNTVYKHTDAGFQKIDCAYSVLGACKGNLYGYSEDNRTGMRPIYLLKADGTEEKQLPALIQFPSCTSNTIFGQFGSAVYPTKNTVAINGQLLMFGGGGVGKDTQTYGSTNRYGTSIRMASVNVTNCKEPKLLLVTDK